MEVLAETQNIRKSYEKQNLFTKKREQVSAVNGVSLRIRKGCSVGLIGESGSGKSTLGRMMAGLETPTEGQALFRGRSISNISLRKMRPLRRNIQMIFQNSSSIFDTSYTIGESIAEVIENSEKVSKKECSEKIETILEQVELDALYAQRYPKELSGGQRQRANIARALVLHPEFVVCDEPVSSLDYSLRKQILTLLNDLRNKFGLTYLFITHDLNCVPYVCDMMAIMYAGKIVEQIDLKKNTMQNALHPYTNLLLSCIPAKMPAERKKRMMESIIDTTVIPDSKHCCRFFPRCPFCTERCINEEPLLKEVTSGHLIACHIIP
ncbi:MULTISPECIES: ABC transporter ATP-binding protein [Methanosarcina]|uniref:Oligopeptide transport ATP-binding protein OppF n=2 Tax=Methanosarcina barkeri TaxID=2208 RepID=A0A0E3QYU0_METBA|nr:MULTISPECIES: ABC transporter ATP-binding protein [Methanosarcina]AKB56038.1 Oligopeptide transport ATP-binding protein OppF [Methanosarcina barkeri MS]AKB59515.1 Oligopeptide transport ATP-binding protein OppF [Methanosarcina barkeri 227]OED07433.1 nickel ABC transporter ATP-binding protein [Methanosarcina sp. A14]